MPPQPSPFQPPCLEIHTTARANRMTRTISVMIPRSVNIFSYLFSGRKGFRIQYTRFCPEGQRKVKRKSVIFLKLGLAFWQRPCYNNHVPVRSARKKYGGLAQLVRAPASHAGGLGFESLILHHTVRTRTRFFMKKGSGTFFVYRRFAFATATNTPVGCLSNRTVCVSRWRGFAPTSSAARVCRAVNEQRQGITVTVISCLLLCGIKFALCELGHHPI